MKAAVIFVALFLPVAICKFQSATVAPPPPPCVIDKSKDGKILRVKPDAEDMFLIMEGCARLIPTNETYNQLFKDEKTCVSEDPELEKMCKCPPLSCDAKIAKHGAGHIFQSNNIMYWIYNWEAFNKFCFDTGAIQPWLPECNQQTILGPPMYEKPK